MSYDVWTTKLLHQALKLDIFKVLYYYFFLKDLLSGFPVKAILSTEYFLTHYVILSFP